MRYYNLLLQLIMFWYCLIIVGILFFFFFFFKQKTAYEMRISDWSSDVCSSDLTAKVPKPWSLMSSPSINADPICLIASSTMAETIVFVRSEERRVRKECVSTCRSRWSPYH